MADTNVHFMWKSQKALKYYRHAVCLHGHTLFSQENMGPIFQRALRIPLLSNMIQREVASYQKRTGCRIDATRAYWTPPLSPREAFDCESRSIESRLGLEAMVSLTDHDDIQAASVLMSMDDTIDTPISFEWTVPFGKTYFHLGVHNLPPAHATQLKEELCCYQTRPEGCLLTDLLGALNEYPDVLIVFNHPFWNQPMIDLEHHLLLVEAFLQQHGRSLHALELNGVNSWRKNRKTLRLAKEYDYPVVAGGDRHACVPAAVVNLTKATTFSEFVAEVRYGKLSTIAVMPHYLEPLKFRNLEDFWDIVRDYPEHPFGRKHWSERTFYISDDGSHRPLFAISEFSGGDAPRPVRYVLSAMEFLHKHPKLRPAVRFALSDGRTTSSEIAS
jgi:hypothetical protein